LKKNRFANNSVILATTQALEYYAKFCERQKAKNPYDKDYEIFQDKHQAFYAAAIIGHEELRGERYEVKGKLDELIRIGYWTGTGEECTNIRDAFTYLVKLNYKHHDKKPIQDDEVIDVVAELAECGIRKIHKIYESQDEFNFQGTLDELKKLDK